MISLVNRNSTLYGYKQTIKKVDVTAREAVIWRYKVAVDQSLLLMPRSLTMDHADTPHSPNMNGRSPFQDQKYTTN